MAPRQAETDELYLTFAPPLWALTPHPHPCEHCGADVNAESARFCSDRCRAAAWRAARKRRTE